MSLCLHVFMLVDLLYLRSESNKILFPIFIKVLKAKIYNNWQLKATFTIKSSSTSPSPPSPNRRKCIRGIGMKNCTMMNILYIHLQKNPRKKILFRIDNGNCTQNVWCTYVLNGGIFLEAMLLYNSLCHSLTHFVTLFFQIVSILIKIDTSKLVNLT